MLYAHITQELLLSEWATQISIKDCRDTDRHQVGMCRSSNTNVVGIQHFFANPKSTDFQRHLRQIRI